MSTNDLIQWICVAVIFIIVGVWCVRYIRNLISWSREVKRGKTGAPPCCGGKTGDATHSDRTCSTCAGCPGCSLTDTDKMTSKHTAGKVTPSQGEHSCCNATHSEGEPSGSNATTSEGEHCCCKPSADIKGNGKCPNCRKSV